MFYQIILRFIFYHQNVGIELGPRNTKLFIIELGFWIFLNYSIPIVESKVMVDTQELCDHTKTCRQSQISRSREKLENVFCQVILQPIFDHQNVGIELGLWNTNLFIIELTFRIFFNHSIPILKLKVMSNAKELCDHTKPCEKKNFKSHVEVKSLATSLLLVIRSLRPPFVIIHQNSVLVIYKKVC